MKLSDTLKISFDSAGALLVYLWIALIVPNVWLCFTEGMSWQANAVNILLPAGLYLLAASSAACPGKAVWWMFIFIFFDAFEIALLYLFGGSVIAVDMFLNLVTSNPSEMAELLGNMWIIILVILVLYLPLLVFGVMAIRRRLTLPSVIRSYARRVSVVLIAAGLVAMGLAYASGSRSGIEEKPYYNPLTQLFPVNAFYNLCLAVERENLSVHYSETSADDRYYSQHNGSDSIPELYILVIGETSRAADWQLAGYSRDTNPKLSKREGVVFFPHTMSESNTTHKSVPMLLTDVDSYTFGDSLHLRRGIISALGEAGFSTAFISAQMRNHSFIDHLGEEADTAFFIKDSAGMTDDVYDFDLLPIVAAQINDTTARHKLIVVHTYGSHFKYHDRYPREYARFVPDQPMYTSAACRDQFVNAYDNTILYTDALLDSIISMAASSGKVAALAYVSDHGEDIFDDTRERFLHASPTPTGTQLHVPMLLWFSDSFCGLRPSMVEAARRHAADEVSSSRSLFHTVLHMAGIESPRLRVPQALTHGSYAAPRRIYLTDHNEPVSYHAAGFTPYDFEYLRNHNISEQ